MKQSLPWNVMGIPPEAREAAQAAAGREGLSLGDWLTLRILAEGGHAAGAAERIPLEDDSYSANRARDEEVRGDHEGLIDRIARTEAEAESAFRRIDDTLRNMTRRLETTERSQNEANRTISSAAAEINSATRDQAHAFDLLAQRIEHVERGADSTALRDAVRGLHQGLSRLADQIARAATESTSQATAMASNIEALASRLADMREETHHLTQTLDTRVGALETRLQANEAAGTGGGQLTERLATEVAELKNRAVNAENTLNLAEHKLADVEAKMQEALGRHLAGIERTLANIAGRLDRAEQQGDSTRKLEEMLNRLTERLEENDKRNRDTLSELRNDLTNANQRIDAMAANSPLVTAPAATPPVSDLDLPPFLEPPPHPGFTPQHPPNADFEPLPPLETSDVFAPQPEPHVEAPHHASRDYLATAHRAAQAAVKADPPADRRMSHFHLADESSNHRAPLVAGIVGLILLAALAGWLLTRGVSVPRLSGGTPPAPASTAPSAKTPAPAQNTPSLAAGPKASATPRAANGSGVSLTPYGEEPAPGETGDMSDVYNAQAEGPLSRSRAASAAQAPAARPVPAASGPTTPSRAPSVSPLDRLMSRAKAGDATAQLILGLKYLDGDRVTTSDSEAVRWLRQAAQQGQPIAQYRLGTLYERGRGVSADAKQAVFWYQKAAAQGNRKAMHNLAVAYADGLGVMRDYAQAAHWFRQASDLGLTDSQFNLAVLYERGLGVPLSPSDAYKWYAIAAAKGDSESKSRVEALATQISAADRQAGKREANSFHPKPMDTDANETPDLDDAAP